MRRHVTILAWTVSLWLSLSAASGADWERDLIVIDRPEAAVSPENASPSASYRVTALDELAELVVLDSDLPEDMVDEPGSIRGAGQTPPPEQLLPVPTPPSVIRAPLALDELRDLVTFAAPTAQPDFLDDLVSIAPHVPALVESAAAPEASRVAVAEATARDARDTDPFAGDLVALTPESPVLPDAAPERRPSPLPELPSLPPPLPGESLAKARAAFAAIESRCLGGETAEARRIFDGLPAFGFGPDTDRVRADSVNLLVLNYCIDGDIDEARRIYDALPADAVTDAIAPGKARAILNLATFYARADRLDEAHAIFQDIAPIGPRGEIRSDLFKLAARLIPYLDNGGKYEEAADLYEKMIKMATVPGALPHFCLAAPALTRYFLGRPSVVHSTPDQDRRLAFMEGVFASYADLGEDSEMIELRRSTAEAMRHFYTVTGDNPKAEEMRLFMAALPSGPVTDR